MRTHDDHRTRSVTLLSLQPLEPRLPLAANVTALVAHTAVSGPHIKVAAAATVRVHAVAMPRVSVDHGNLAAAGQAATAAKEAARVAAAAAAAGHAPPDVSHAMASSVAGRLDRFGIGGAGAYSQPAATGVPGLDLSLPGRGDGLAALREKYGLTGGGTSGSGGAAETSEDVRAAVEARGGMAAADKTDKSCGKTPEERKKKEESYEVDLRWVRFEHHQMCRHDKSGRPEDRKAHEAWQHEIDAVYSKAQKCMDQVKKDEQEAAKKTKGCPVPDDDRNTPPHRTTPPGTHSEVPHTRSGLASMPVPDADAVVRRSAGSVRGQATTNPALDHGREYVVPRGTVSAVHVRSAAFALHGKVINPKNTY